MTNTNENAPSCLWLDLIGIRFDDSEPMDAFEEPSFPVTSAARQQMVNDHHAAHADNLLMAWAKREAEKRGIESWGFSADRSTLEQAERDGDKIVKLGGLQQQMIALGAMRGVAADYIAEASEALLASWHSEAVTHVREYAWTPTQEELSKIARTWLAAKIAATTTGMGWPAANVPAGIEAAFVGRVVNAVR